jgi:hypothetical protein
MTDHGTARPDDGPSVRIDIDTAEELVETSSAHARGELDDAEFLDRREQVLTRHEDDVEGSAG